MRDFIYFIKWKTINERTANYEEKKKKGEKKKEGKFFFGSSKIANSSVGSTSQATNLARITSVAVPPVSHTFLAPTAVTYPWSVLDLSKLIDIWFNTLLASGNLFNIM